MAILLRRGALEARGAGGRLQATHRPDPALAAAHGRVGRDARPGHASASSDEAEADAW